MNSTFRKPYGGKENVPLSAITAAVTTAATTASGAAIAPLTAESNYRAVSGNDPPNEAIIQSPAPNTCREVVLYSATAAAAITRKPNPHESTEKAGSPETTTSENSEDAFKHGYSANNYSRPSVNTKNLTGIGIYTRKEKSERLVSHPRSGDKRPGVWEKDSLNSNEGTNTSSESYADSDIEDFDTTAFRKEIDRWLENTEGFRSQLDNAMEAEEVADYILRTYDNDWASSDDESSESTSTESGVSQDNLNSKDSDDDETKEDKLRENESKESKLVEDESEEDKLKENNTQVIETCQTAEETGELRDDESKSNKAKENESEDDEGKNNVLEDDDVKEDNGEDNKAGDDGLKENQNSENDRNGPRYEQLPGSRSGFNSRTGKTNAELEYAMHRLTVRDEKPSPFEPDEIPKRRVNHYQDLFSSDEDYMAEDEDADDEDCDDEDDYEDDQGKDVEHDFNSLVCASPPRHERARDHRGRLW